MAATTAAANDGGIETTSSGKEAIRKLKSTDPPLYLSPTPDLSESARLASEYLFSSLKPYAPKTPFSQLLVKGFDAEQIWQQIDIQSQPLISSLKRKVHNFEKNPEEIKKLFKPVEENVKDLSVNGGFDDFEDDDETAFGDDDEEDDEEDDDEEEAEAEAEDEGEGEGEYEYEDEGEGEEEDEDEGEDEYEEEGEKEGKGKEGEDEEEKLQKEVKEDEFFKLDELEKYMEMDEAREYGLNIEKKKGKKRGHDEFAEEDEEENEGGDDEDEPPRDQLALMGLDDDDDDEGENARFNDLWDGKKGKTAQKRKNKSVRVSDNLQKDGGLSDEDNDQKHAKPSTHEMDLEKMRAAIKEMERANMDPKSWTMQGEVTAAKRPKNSALGVDLDFERNVQPALVITKEFDESLEDMITKRVIEHGFDDNEKLPTLPSRAPREVKELDENKSKEGLADIYEQAYGEHTGLVSVAVSLSEQQKKEAKLLFKELCSKLDALSHFYLTPKPNIEEMSIQNNVPAFAIEETAPVAMSDAAMLAPEEVFAGKGDIKDETELTQAERKRRRANKKRKFKANEAKKVVKTLPTPQVNEAENNS